MASVIITKRGGIYKIDGGVSGGGYVVSSLDAPYSRGELSLKWVVKVIKDQIWDETIETRIREQYPQYFI